MINNDVKVEQIVEVHISQGDGRDSGAGGDGGGGGGGGEGGRIGIDQNVLSSETSEEFGKEHQEANDIPRGSESDFEGIDEREKSDTEVI